MNLPYVTILYDAIRVLSLVTLSTPIPHEKCWMFAQKTPDRHSHSRQLRHSLLLRSKVIPFHLRSIEFSPSILVPCCAWAAQPLVFWSYLRNIQTNPISGQQPQPDSGSGDGSHTTVPTTRTIARELNLKIDKPLHPNYCTVHSVARLPYFHRIDSLALCAEKGFTYGVRTQKTVSRASQISHPTFRRTFQQRLWLGSPSGPQTATYVERDKHEAFVLPLR